MNAELVFRPMGEDAFLIECADPAGLHLLLTADPAPDQVESVPAEATLLVSWSPVGNRQRVREHVQRVANRAGSVSEGFTTGRQFRIPVRYDGEDLAELADRMEVPVTELVCRHIAAVWRVAFVGFAPGFGYLNSPDWPYPVPRHSSPRTTVTAGSVAVAGHYSGIYPRSSPGGWQLLGRTEVPLWDLDREEPALFAAGDTVRFEQLR